MTRRLWTSQFVGAAVLVAGLTSVGCEKVPLLAPTGSSITLTTATNTLAANGSATIVAQVLESSGTPPHSGTRVTFLTTLGTLEPTEASTDASGRATVTFKPNGASGIAEISATSGGATTSTTSTTSGGANGGTATGANRNLTIYVGAAAVGRVLIAANPVVLPTAGGATTVTASVLDRNGNALASAPVSFVTTAGTLSATVVNTDASGNASVTLTTFQAATVTATVGVGSSSGGTSGGDSNTTGSASNTQASVSVSLTNAPTVQITPPTTPPSAGLPSTFTFRVTPATAGASGGSGSGGTGGSTGGTVPIREVIIDWGDGVRDNVGAVSGEQVVAHTWRSAGTYTVSATVTDVAGGSARVATAVTVIPVPRPTIIITPTPSSAPGGSNINFSIQITAPSGLAISNVVIDFGDGTTQALGGATGIINVSHTYAAGVRTYNIFVTVTDSTGQSTIGSTTVSITT